MSLFLDRGFTATTVDEIARAAGVSVRTFHRYFPAKADSVGPALDRSWEFYLEEFAARPAGEPVLESVLVALDRAISSEQGRRYRDFLRALPELPELQTIWLATNERCRIQLTAPLAARLGLTHQHPRAAYAAACITMATRLGVEAWARSSRGSVVRATRECLTLIDEALLRPVSTPAG